MRRRGKIARDLDKQREEVLAQAFDLAGKAGLWVRKPAVVYVPCLVCPRWGMIERIMPHEHRGAAIVVCHVEARSTSPGRRLDRGNVGLACPFCNSKMETDPALVERLRRAVEEDGLEAAILSAARRGR